MADHPGQRRCSPATSAGMLLKYLCEIIGENVVTLCVYSPIVAYTQFQYMNDLGTVHSQSLQPATSALAQPAAQQAVALIAPLKYAREIKEIAQCPCYPNYTDIGIGYRFALADVTDTKNFLPLALLDPDRTMPGRKPITTCCEGWSLSMFTTLDALQARAAKAAKRNPKFLKRVGDHYTQVKLTDLCGVQTEPNNSGHFEFFERATFDGHKAVISHGKMAL